MTYVILVNSPCGFGQTLSFYFRFVKGLDIMILKTSFLRIFLGLRTFPVHINVFVVSTHLPKIFLLTIRLHDILCRPRYHTCFRLLRPVIVQDSLVYNIIYLNTTYTNRFISYECVSEDLTQ